MTAQPKLAEQVAAKVAAAKDAAKLKKATPPAAPSKSAPPVPKAPATSPAVQARTADEAWAELKARNPFRFHSDASELGGVHTKYFYLDEAGDKWLFKPISEDFRAWGDEVAYLIQREIDTDAIEVRVIELKDLHGKRRQGSIQKMKKGLKDPANFEKVDIASIDPAELIQIQREQVVDWLISNHDGHAGQFLRAQDGRVYGIDKGQLYKYFGRDKLAIDYAPNAGGRFDEPLYNKLLRAHRDGKIKLDLQATEERIRRVEAISDAAFREMLMPYASRRFAGQAGALEDFLRAAVERKNSIRQEFERFYGGLESARLGRKVEFRFGGAVPEASPAAAADDALAWARGSRIDLQEEVKAIREAGWQGRSIAVDKGDIEDQNVLVREALLPGGGKRTTLQMKLRPDADRKLVAFLEANASGDIGLVRGPADPFWGTILNAVKTLNHHAASDLVFNADKVTDALALRPKLIALSKSGNAMERAMAKRYLKVLNDVEATSALQRKGTSATIPQVKQYKPTALELRDASKAPKDPAGGVQVKGRNRWTEDKMTPVGTEVRLVTEDRPLSEFFSSLRDDLREYEIVLGDGVKAVYKPFQAESLIEGHRLADERAFALQGRLTIKVDKAVSEQVITDALSKLKGLGIDAAPASALDEELMYLQKVAYVAKMDRTAAFMKAAEDARQAGGTEEAVRIWRNTWSQHLGVADVTKLPDYNPVGVHQMAAATGKLERAGLRVQHRFDLGAQQIRKGMDTHVLTHEIYNGTIHDFFEVVLPTNGSFIPTADRFASGVPIGGMSPGRDLDTGGASYFFTRIVGRDAVPKGRILLKTDMLRRADAISYARDTFGQTVGNIVRNERFNDVTGWKRCSRNVRNETIFKGAIPVLENLEGVLVSGAYQKKELVALFHKHGIKKLPDGRLVEDVIVTEMSQLKRTR